MAQFFSLISACTALVLVAFAIANQAAQIAA
jgi:hypothetical protein